ncbi:hypothetical protein B0H14DRAFT_3778524 [Mycena olivaceomarginata]|nr:hypothetical protein B0H14DRAFT_3778524 [Mycena olivaceomarginata]
MKPAVALRDASEVEVVARRTERRAGEDLDARPQQLLSVVGGRWIALHCSQGHPFPLCPSSSRLADVCLRVHFYSLHASSSAKAAIHMKPVRMRHRRKRILSVADSSLFHSPQVEQTHDEGSWSIYQGIPQGNPVGGLAPAGKEKRKMEDLGNRPGQNPDKIWVLARRPGQNPDKSRASGRNFLKNGPGSIQTSVKGREQKKIAVSEASVPLPAIAAVWPLIVRRWPRSPYHMREKPEVSVFPGMPWTTCTKSKRLIQWRQKSNERVVCGANHFEPIERAEARHHPDLTEGLILGSVGVCALFSKAISVGELRPKLVKKRQFQSVNYVQSSSRSGKTHRRITRAEARHYPYLTEGLILVAVGARALFSKAISVGELTSKARQAAEKPIGVSLYSYIAQRAEARHYPYLTEGLILGSVGSHALFWRQFQSGNSRRHGTIRISPRA